MTPSLPQTVVLLSLSMGKQPWIAPAVRAILVKQRWIEQAGTRVVSGAVLGFDASRPHRRGSREVPSWAITQGGRDALAASTHIDAARGRISVGMQRSPWL